MCPYRLLSHLLLPPGSSIHGHIPTTSRLERSGRGRGQSRAGEEGAARPTAGPGWGGGLVAACRRGAQSPSGARSRGKSCHLLRSPERRLFVRVSPYAHDRISLYAPPCWKSPKHRLSVRVSPYVHDHISLYARAKALLPPNPTSQGVRKAMPCRHSRRHGDALTPKANALRTVARRGGRLT